MLYLERRRTVSNERVPAARSRTCLLTVERNIRNSRMWYCCVYLRASESKHNQVKMCSEAICLNIQWATFFPALFFLVILCFVALAWWKGALIKRSIEKTVEPSFQGTNSVRYLHLFCALFVLCRVELDNNLSIFLHMTGFMEDVHSRRECLINGLAVEPTTNACSYFLSVNEST